MEFAVNSLLDSWLEAHPSVFWSIEHPILTIVVLLIGVVLFARLLAAIASLIDRLWLWLLKSPILLLKSIFRGKPKETEEPIQNSGYITIDNSTQLEKIAAQLTIITHQQQQLLQEIAQLKEARDRGSRGEGEKINEL
jgi:hypothetical protein